MKVLRVRSGPLQLLQGTGPRWIFAHHAPNAQTGAAAPSSTSAHVCAALLQAYTLREAEALYSAGGPDSGSSDPVPFVAARNTSWAAVATAAQPDWAAAEAGFSHHDCCALRKGRDTIRFDLDCSPQDLHAQNFTAAAMAAAAA